MKPEIFILEDQILSIESYDKFMEKSIEFVLENELEIYEESYTREKIQALECLKLFAAEIQEYEKAAKLQNIIKRIHKTHKS